MLQNHDQNQNVAAAKTGGKSVSTDRALNARLRELHIDPNGLPPQVLACLHVAVDAEVDRVQKELTAAIAALQQRADERIAKQIGRAVTLQSVGKAFSAAASATKATAKSAAVTTGTGGAAK